MKSKNYLLFISFYFICFLGNAQSPNWLWANAIGGAGDDKANNCVVDEEGNVYIIGFFRGTVDFDPSPSTNIINGTTSNNLFITKSSSSGNLIWAKALVGSNSLSGVDNFSGFLRDKNGNFFITGGFLMFEV